MHYVLTNVKFDNSYKNACYFSTTDVREQALHPQNFDAVKKRVNFNLGNVLFTSIIVNTYNNENYCIVHDDEKNNYYYFFVTSARYKAVNQWELELERDVITQYITAANSNTFSNSNIIRAHCNRWVTDGNKVKFDVSTTSQIIKHESKLAKVVERRNKVNLKWCNNQTFDNWINSNILCWLYVFIDVKHLYDAGGYLGNPSQVVPQTYKSEYLRYVYWIGDSEVSNDYAIISFPVYKSSPRIIIQDEINKGKCVITLDSLNDFYELNNGAAYVYNIKLSSIPPVDFSRITDFAYNIDESGNLVLLLPQVTEGDLKKGWRSGVVDVDGFGSIDIENNYVVLTGGFVNVWQQFDLIDSNTVNLNHKFIFDKSDVKGKRNIEFEPKVLCDCYDVVLRDSADGEFVYTMLHIGQQNIKVLYTEGLNATNNNYYYRLESSGVIPADNQDNWNGIVNTVDYSQIVANDNVATFLANNKNFLLTKSASIGIPLLASALTGDVGGVVGAGQQFASTLVDYDNLRNRSNSLRNTNDSVILNMLVNEGLQLYVDIEKAFDVDIDSYYNYLYNFGYSVNKIDNPFNYINTRKYFNYIQFDADFININAPSNVEDKLKSIFRNGVRLWNDYSSIYNYTDENYENYL